MHLQYFALKNWIKTKKKTKNSINNKSIEMNSQGKWNLSNVFTDHWMCSQFYAESVMRLNKWVKELNEGKKMKQREKNKKKTCKI